MYVNRTIKKNPGAVRRAEKEREREDHSDGPKTKKKREQKKEGRKEGDNGNTFTVKRKSKNARNSCVYMTSSIRFYERIIVRNTVYETIK